MNKTFADKAYQSTKISKQHTMTKIENMLSELNINDIRFTREANDHSIEFLVKMDEQEHPRRVKIVIPFTPILGETVKQAIRRENAIFRIVLNNLKNRFVSVTNGLKEFDAEFMSDIVIIHEGKEMRLSDIIVPEIKRQLKQNTQVVLKIDQSKS